MKKTFFPGATIYLLLVYLWASSCSPIYYSPNSHNVPLLKQKGDARVGLHGNSTRLEVSTAFAVEGHVGLTLDGGMFFPADDEQGDGGKGQFIQVGAGYFKPIGEKWVFETYGQFGYGKVQNHFPSTLDSFPSTTGIIDANLARYGIQPSFGFSSRFFDAAISARICGLSYFNTGGSLIYDREDQVLYLRDQGTQFLIEPALTLRGGLEYLKLQVQIGRSINVTNSDFRQDDGHVSVGLVYLMNKK